jgi:hypothetical protein
MFKRNKQLRGFALLSKEKRSEIARMGGRKSRRTGVANRVNKAISKES